MSEFHDPELRRELGRLSGSYPDDNVAFAAWQRRVVQARRRRAVAWATGAAMSLVVATVAAAALQTPTRHSLVPSRSTESGANPTVSVLETEAEDSPTVQTTMPETTSDVSEASDTTSVTVPDIETSIATDEGIAGGSNPSGGGGSTKGHGGSTTPPPPASLALTQTFTSTGGSVTVRIDGDALVLVTTTPAAGFHVDGHKAPDHKVEVTFRSSNHESQITVKLMNGAMKPSVVEKSDSSETTVPDATADGPPNGDGGNNRNPND